MMPRPWIITAICLFIFTTGCLQANADSEAVTSFVHVNLVPMIREAVIPDQTVLIQGKHILAVGPSEQIRLPENATVISCADAYLMPGLADMHMHLSDGGRPMV